MGVSFEEMNEASNPVPLAGLASNHGLTKDRILAKLNVLLDARKPQIVNVKGIFAPWSDENLPDNAKVVMRTSEEAIVEFTFDDSQVQLSTAKEVASLLDWKPAQKVELGNDVDEWFLSVSKFLLVLLDGLVADLFGGLRRVSDTGREVEVPSARMEYNDLLEEYLDLKAQQSPEVRAEWKTTVDPKFKVVGAALKAWKGA